MFTSSKIKLANLIDSNYSLLGILSRMGIEGSFGEKTVEEICGLNGISPETFLLICNVYSFPDYKPTDDVLRVCRPQDIIRYLHQSHAYYLDNALVTIASSLEKLLEPCAPTQQKVVWKFFSDYKAELDKHFTYEEGNVFPYVNKLLSGCPRNGFSIDQIEEHHINIEEKLSDLKNLVLKSLPHECDNRLRVRLLNFIFNLESDLARHTRVEDELLVPMVRLIENPYLSSTKADSRNDEDETDKSDLSEREKEILVSVAQGLINKEIAEKHHISINTVITHRKNITRKTGIKTVAGLTVYAILNNLIDINSVE